jgi:hypothetical protein
VVRAVGCHRELSLRQKRRGTGGEEAVLFQHEYSRVFENAVGCELRGSQPGARSVL